MARSIVYNDTSSNSRKRRSESRAVKMGGSGRQSPPRPGLFSSEVFPRLYSSLLRFILRAVEHEPTPFDRRFIAGTGQTSCQTCSGREHRRCPHHGSGSRCIDHPQSLRFGPDHTGRLYLEGVSSDMVVLSWLFPRAAYWLLNRIEIKGHEGQTQLKPPTTTRNWKKPRPNRQKESALQENFRIGTSIRSTCTIPTGAVEPFLEKFAALPVHAKSATRGKKPLAPPASLRWWS